MADANLNPNEARQGKNGKVSLEDMLIGTPLDIDPIVKSLIANNNPQGLHLEAISKEFNPPTYYVVLERNEKYVLIDSNTPFDLNSKDNYAYQVINFSPSEKGYSANLERRIVVNPSSEVLKNLYTQLKTKLDKYKSSNINILPLILKEVQSFVEKTLKGGNNAFKKYEEGTVESFLDEAIKNKSGDEVDAALTTWVLLSMLKNDNYIRGDAFKTAVSKKESGGKNDNYIRGDARIKSFYNPEKKRVEVVCKYRTSHGVEIPISFYK